MGFSYTSYFGLARVSDMGPEVKDWAVTNTNPEITTLILKSLTLHKHGAATPIRYPGYNYAAPATPTQVNITNGVGTGGMLSPGANIGVRLAYLDALGLETEASPEVRTLLASIPGAPLPPQASNPQATPTGGALGGGTYVYAMTKGKGTGETQLSGVTQVDVPFDTTGFGSSVVPLTFPSISSYADGTDSLNLYRATGLTAEFQLAKKFTDTAVTNYNDDGSITSTQAPPRTNTFDRNKYVAIDFSTLSHPPQAQALRVYVTNTPGVYGTNQLLQEINLTTPYQTQINYLGSENLLRQYPSDFSQIPSNPPKLRLNTEATGAPVLTEFMDFQGYESLNFVFPRNLAHSTPMLGAAYYDVSADAVKVRLQAGFLTLATPTGSYIHPALESGGHPAANIGFGSQNLNTVASIIANNSAGQVRKQVSVVRYATPTGINTKKTDTVASTLNDMQIQLIPAYAGSWVELSFNGQLLIDPKGAAANTATLQLELNGSLVAGAGTVRSFTAAATPTQQGIDITYATPISAPLTVRVFWNQTGGELTSIGTSRFLLGKEIF